ncbi:oligosaccharide flippase family protein [Wenyingzhuangia marina]|uniref:Membrane protein involved in the export of O-antigen and teichoic acid n=1 Tax=Wenyingzhuangia marina TaxID=1195760 RepID=A0A1M5WD93_9FLAO|nr:oligosaccharide flippase family protein [Wenyingzhuangia marina]GGF81763.1 teichoic acid transporter [Wenyingzhuangia marina]SHH85420.1 Membrane protein involved in the export of O-antigen and teichoic acid [Wenyingzhuangia marina]
MINKKVFQLVENVSALFSLKVIDLGLSLWLIPYLILKIGLHNYGVYALAMSLILFFVNILNYGFNLSTVRELARHKNDNIKVNLIFNEVFSVKLFLFALLFLLFIGVSFIIPKFSEHFHLYFFASLILLGDLFSLRWFFMGIEKMKFMTLIHLCSTGIFTILVLICITLPSDYVTIPLYEAIGLLISAVFSFIWVLKKYKIQIKLISFTAVLNYLKIHFNSFVNLLLPSTSGTLIVLLSGMLVGPSFVGLTQIGVKFTAAFTTLNTILTSAFYPLINRNKEIEVTTRKILNSLGFLVSISMFLLGEFLTKTWLNFESEAMMQNMVMIVKILSPIPFLAALVSSYGINGLLTQYKDKLFGRITLISTSVMLITAIVLVPLYPIIGAAVSFLSARIVYSGLSYYYLKANR